MMLITNLPPPICDRMTHKQALAFKSRFFDPVNHGLTLYLPHITASANIIGTAQRRKGVPLLLVVPHMKLPY